jgi:hypothetical protein
MPASDYTSTVSGGLKLKGGAKDAGVKKKSKKSKSSKDKTAKPEEAAVAAREPEAAKPSDTTLALSNQPSDHDRDVTPSASTGGTGTGKTEAQRRHEEIKRKRVSHITYH